jgi:hypothetical protein
MLVGINTFTEGYGGRFGDIGGGVLVDPYSRLDLPDDRHPGARCRDADRARGVYGDHTKGENVPLIPGPWFMLPLSKGSCERF